MIDSLVKIIVDWPVVWQFFFILIMSGFMTQITCTLITGLTQDVSHAIAVLIRGWPKNSDDEEEETK